MAHQQGDRSTRRGYLAAGAGVAALALSAVLAPTATAASTPPAYTVVEAMQQGVVRVDNSTGAVSQASSLSPDGEYDGSVAITPDGRTAYVTKGNTLTPVSVAGGTVGTSIVVGPDAGPVAITPDGSVAYVGNALEGTVTPVRLATGVALAPIAVSTVQVLGLAFTPNGKYAYVLGSDDTGFVSSVTPIVVATGIALPPIALGGAYPGDRNFTANDVIRISPDGRTAYVAGLVQPVVFTIDLTTNTTGPQIQLGQSGPATVLNLAISPDGKKLFAGTLAGVVPVTLATGTVGATIAIPAGVEIADMAITPDGKVLYISHRHNDQLPGPPFELVPIDLATMTAGSPIVTDPSSAASGGVAALAITPDQAPVAKVTAQSVTCPLAYFDASGSTVRYGTIVRYVWNFGDGSTAVTTTPTTTHTYAQSGMKKVTITETDSAGTSTQQVFTGQTLSLNGGQSALAHVGVLVLSQSFPACRPNPPPV